MGQLVSLIVVPHVVCSNGRQYSLFKHNTVQSNLESVAVWGYLPGTEIKKLLLSTPINTDYVSTMIDICVPHKLENLQFKMKSANGKSWSFGSYLTIFDFISNIGLLTTALTEPGEMTLSFPSRTLLCESSLDQVATIPLHITVNVPSYWDRVFISIWCSYNGYDMMVGVLYNPFPYYQYLIRTVNVPQSSDEHYTVHFHNFYSVSLPTAVTLGIQVRDRLVGQFSYTSEKESVFPLCNLGSWISFLGTSIFCPAEVFRDVSYPLTHIDAVAEVLCDDNTVGYRRQCDSWGVWKEPEGPGCRCPREEDSSGRVWESAVGGSLQSQTCGVAERGTVQRACDVLGSWKNVRSHCVRRVCADTWMDGIFLASLPVNSSHTLACTYGQGEYQFYCTPHERWIFMGSTCDCDALLDEYGYQWPPSPANGTHSLPCTEGFSGVVKRRCGVDGKWENISQQCTQKICPSIQERYVTYPATVVNTVAIIPCPAPFSGTIQRVCGPDEQWGRILDNCMPPSCEGLIVDRDRHGCVLLDAVERQPEEQLQVTVLPTPPGLAPVFNATLPATVCGLETNIPYEIWLQRMVPFPLVCVLENVYSRQRCEMMTAPVLRERVEDENGYMAIRVLVELPFCFDQRIQAIQVRIECVQACSGENPKILSHSCTEGKACQPGSIIVISSFSNLLATSTYSVSTRALPVKTTIATVSQWSPAVIVQPVQQLIAVQPQVTVVPKSSHSVKLLWSLSNAAASIPFTNFILHIFVSSPQDHTTDTRYLTYIDSQPLCSGQELCRRRSIVVPVTDTGLRYVYVLESEPVYATGLLLRNGTATYIVPAAPSVRSIVTNFDTYVNVTFLEANMDLLLECTLLDAQSHSLTTFTLYVDYDEVVSQIIGDLVSLTEYSLRCSVRDGFKTLREFSLALRPVALTPIVVSINITQSTFTHVEATLSANKQGTFFCVAANSRSPTELSWLTPAMIDRQGFRKEYNAPLLPSDTFIPLNEVYSEDRSYDMKVFVVCDFVTTHGNGLQASQLLKAQAAASQEEYHPRIIATVPPPHYEGVYSHANLTLTFSTTIHLHRGLQYYFVLEPLDRFTPYLTQRPEAFREPCPYTDASGLTCEGYEDTYRYSISRIRSEDCIVDGARLILPLPQLESQLPYGVRMSLPDMIIDQRARTELEATDLEQGRYLYTFISMTSSERVFASLIQPYQSWNASLDTLLEVRYSGQGFVTSNGSIILRPIFGGVGVSIPINSAGVSVRRDQETFTTVLIQPQRYMKLEPCMTYELYLPANLWKHQMKESPGIERFFFRTVDSWI